MKKRTMRTRKETKKNEAKMKEETKKIEETKKMEMRKEARALYWSAGKSEAKPYPMGPFLWRLV